MGGALGPRAKQELDRLLNGENPSSKHQAAILEIASTGRLDQANKVSVQVESFGDSRTGDAMFLKYDERASQRIRESFRLPPLYLGDVAAHNFATSRNAVLMAEAQVFAPERQEEDEQLSGRLLRALPDGRSFEFRSFPVVVDDAELQHKCVELAAKESLANGEELVRALNKVCGLDIRHDEEDRERSRQDRRAVADAMGSGLAGRRSPGDPQVPPGEQDPEDDGEGEGDEVGDRVARKREASYLAFLGIELADAVAGQPGSDLRDVMEKLEQLDPACRDVVREAATAAALGQDRRDLVRLFSCVGQAVAGTD
jgi:hypothetical protein